MPVENRGRTEAVLVADRRGIWGLLLGCLDRMAKLLFSGFLAFWIPDRGSFEGAVLVGGVAVVESLQ